MTRVASRLSLSPAVPLSQLKATVKALVWLSKVKLNAAEVATLPAASVARTCTVLAPSAAVKVVAQVLPLVLYSSWLSLSAMTLMVPLLVTLSLVLTPLSLIRLSTGVAMLASISKGNVCAALVLPAGSVAMMLTLPLAITKVGVTLQLPSAATVVLSTSSVPGIVTWMMSPALPVPLIVGVSSLVRRSVLAALLLASSSLTVKLGAFVSTA